jgi:hypothetical protein
LGGSERRGRIFLSAGRDNDLNRFDNARVGIGMKTLAFEDGFSCSAEMPVHSLL